MTSTRRGFFATLAATGAAILGIKAATPYLDAGARLDRLPIFDFGGPGFQYPQSAMDAETGISFRYIREWNADPNNFINRLDYVSTWPLQTDRLTHEQRVFNPARLPA